MAFGNCGMFRAMAVTRRLPLLVTTAGSSSSSGSSTVRHQFTRWRHSSLYANGESAVLANQQQ